LSDPEEQVHIAAAKALERNLDKTVIAGIKNMLRGSDEEAKQIVAAFINADADEVFKQLVDYEPFIDLAISYLNSTAHPDIKKHYTKLLKEIGRKDLVKVLGEAVTEQMDKENMLIYAVDDSRMILKIYKSTLHQLGYPAQLFEFPESAIEQIKNHKPSIVITDLNMPKMNGIQLTKEIRKLYPKEALPIIMVTTQQDLQDREAAFAAGINDILYKPFKKEQIEEALAKL
jgi:CheY-like chemotaxis protein